jgi:hypothetical protein
LDNHKEYVMVKEKKCSLDRLDYLKLFGSSFSSDLDTATSRLAALD